MTREEIEKELDAYKDIPVIMPLITKELKRVAHQVDSYVGNEIVRETIYDLIGVVLKLSGVVTAIGQECASKACGQENRHGDKEEHKYRN
jgi:hypothetical protein